MKKIILLIMVILLTGCGKGNVEELGENLKQMELYGNLVTYQAYYHNVIEYEKKAGSGVTHLLEQDRELFVEYKGTIKLGISLDEVTIDVQGNEINVKIQDFSWQVRSIKVEKLLDYMGFPYNYMDLIDM